jgi:hypothetical protein
MATERNKVRAQQLLLEGEVGVTGLKEILTFLSRCVCFLLARYINGD